METKCKLAQSKKKTLCVRCSTEMLILTSVRIFLDYFLEFKAFDVS